jgi:hypothetical protein
VDVFELEAVFLELEEAAIDVEEIGRAQVGVVDQLAFGVAQDFFQMDWRHRLKLGRVLKRRQACVAG